MFRRGRAKLRLFWRTTRKVIPESDFMPFVKIGPNHHCIPFGFNPTLRQSSRLHKTHIPPTGRILCFVLCFAMCQIIIGPCLEKELRRRGGGGGNITHNPDKTMHQHQVAYPSNWKTHSTCYSPPAPRLTSGRSFLGPCEHRLFSQLITF